MSSAKSTKSLAPSFPGVAEAAGVVVCSQLPGSPGSSPSVDEKYASTRILGGMQIISQNTLLDVISKPGAGKLEVTQLFSFWRPRVAGRMSTALSLTERQLDVMYALAGCADVMFLIKRVSMQVRKAIQEAYGVDKYNFATWFKNRGRSTGKALCPSHSPSATAAKAGGGSGYTGVKRARDDNTRLGTVTVVGEGYRRSNDASLENVKTHDHVVGVVSGSYSAVDFTPGYTGRHVWVQPSGKHVVIKSEEAEQQQQQPYMRRTAAGNFKSLQLQPAAIPPSHHQGEGPQQQWAQAASCSQLAGAQLQQPSVHCHVLAPDVPCHQQHPSQNATSSQLPPLLSQSLEQHTVNGQEPGSFPATRLHKHSMVNRLISSCQSLLNKSSSMQAGQHQGKAAWGILQGCTMQGTEGRQQNTPTSRNEGSQTPEPAPGDQAFLSDSGMLHENHGSGTELPFASQHEQHLAGPASMPSSAVYAVCVLAKPAASTTMPAYKDQLPAADSAACTLQNASQLAYVACGPADSQHQATQAGDVPELQALKWQLPRRVLCMEVMQVAASRPAAAATIGGSKAEAAASSCIILPSTSGPVEEPLAIVQAAVHELQLNSKGQQQPSVAAASDYLSTYYAEWIGAARNVVSAGWVPACNPQYHGPALGTPLGAAASSAAAASTSVIGLGSCHSSSGPMPAPKLVPGLLLQSPSSSRLPILQRRQQQEQTQQRAMEGRQAGVAIRLDDGRPLIMLQNQAEAQNEAQHELWHQQLQQQQQQGSQQGCPQHGQEQQQQPQERHQQCAAGVCVAHSQLKQASKGGGTPAAIPFDGAGTSLIALQCKQERGQQLGQQLVIQGSGDIVPHSWAMAAMQQQTGEEQQQSWQQQGHQHRLCGHLQALSVMPQQQVMQPASEAMLQACLLPAASAFCLQQVVELQGPLSTLQNTTSGGSARGMPHPAPGWIQQSVMPGQTFVLVPQHSFQREVFIPVQGLPTGQAVSARQLPPQQRIAQQCYAVPSIKWPMVPDVHQQQQ